MLVPVYNFLSLNINVDTSLRFPFARIQKLRSFFLFFIYFRVETPIECLRR